MSKAQASKAQAKEQTAEPLLEFDSKVRDLVVPYRDTAPVKAISWLSEVGDQPQMRVVCGVTLVLGLVRGDPRMIGAGARMLLAHETAVLLKNAVKHRVDRTRPRSASGKREQKPKPGKKTSKEETSFPSGHSAGALAVAQAFSRSYPEHHGKSVAIAATVAVAQVPRCSHYPTDVAAGLVVGAVAEKIVDLAWRLAASALRR